MSMTVEINEKDATYVVEPDHGRRVVFEVTWRRIDVSRDGAWHRNEQWRFVVGLKGSNGRGFAHFTSFEKACRSALYRARRYDKAFSKPRGIAARTAEKVAA